MAFGKLNDEQEAMVRTFVAGRNVHDLGAGDMELSEKLVALGAHTVTAVDKRYSHQRWIQPHGVSAVGEDFEEYGKHGHFIDTVFMSWPEVYNQQGIVTLLEPARVVIYIGTNFDGTSCGSIEMFQHLMKRKVLAYVPHRQNSLIVYALETEYRRPLPEEYAALTRDHSMYSYGESLGEMR